MAEASGPAQLGIIKLLVRSALGRGALFDPMLGSDGHAKLRSRAVMSISKILRPGYNIALCWRYASSAEFRIWKGTVTQRGPGFLFQLGRWRVKYHQRSETLPFPPYDSRIVLCGARIRKPGRSNNRRKARKTRVLCGKHALRDDDPKGSAVKKCLAVGTLNTTSLKLEGDDVFKLKASARLHEIVRYMAQTNLHILDLQETRFTFISGEGFDILKRQLRHGNKIFFIYLMSAVNGYNGMGFITQEPIKA